MVIISLLIKSFQKREFGIKPIQNRIVVYLNNASNKNISKFKNEICNSDKIIFDQLEIEPIEIQKDTAKDEKVRL